MLTTSELLEKLKRCGLDVNHNMLVQDARDGYLPQRGRGRGKGAWDTWEVRRAVYLYRLKRRGLRGQLLRFLLFYRDGWGWTKLKPECVRGLQKCIDIQKSSVRDRTYKKIAVPSDLDNVIDDVSEDLGFKHPEIAKCIYGIGYFGQPLPQGTLRPMFTLLGSMFDSGLDSATLAGVVSALTASNEVFLVQTKMTWTSMVAQVEMSDDETVEAARIELKRTVHAIRSLSRQYVHSNNLPKSQCSNIWSLGGRRSKEISRYLRGVHGRITAAQIAIALMGPSIIVACFARDCYRGAIESVPEIAEMLNPNRTFGDFLSMPKEELHQAIQVLTDLIQDNPDAHSLFQQIEKEIGLVE